MRDQVADDEGLARCVGLKQADEALAEHEWLELQGRIEEPEETQDDLEDPLGGDGEREPSRRRDVRRTRGAYDLSCPRG